MPIYSYQCTTCNHEFDLKQGFDADPTQECPVCQGLSRRLFHPVGVIYKGSGFYTTDYRKPDSSTESKSPDPESSEPSSAGSSSSESSGSSSSSGDSSAPAEKPAVTKSSNGSSAASSSD